MLEKAIVAQRLAKWCEARSGGRGSLQTGDDIADQPLSLG